MKIQLLLLTLLAAAQVAAQTVQPNAWIGQIGGLGADVVFALAETSDRRLCAAGNAWTGGQFGRPDHQVVLETTSAQVMFVACYRRGGELAFVTPLDAKRGDAPRALAALPGGGLLVSGLRETDTRSTSGPAHADIFLVKLDAEGNPLWSRNYGGVQADSGNALAAAPDGGAYLAGGFEGRLTWQDGTRLAKLNSVGSRDATVMRLDPDGNIVWAHGFGGSGFDEATVVTPRRDGGVIVGGTFRKTISIGELSLVSRGYRDVFIAALAADGTLEWARQIGGPGQDEIRGLAQNSARVIAVAGNFQRQVVLPQEHELVSAGSTDVFVALFDAAGDALSAVSFGGPLTDQVFDLAIDASDNLLLAGHYQGRTDMAPGLEVAALAAQGRGNSGGYLLVLDPDAKFLRVDGVAGAGMEMAMNVAPLADGGVGLAGLYNKDLSIAGLAVDAARGKTDVFIARIGHDVRLSRKRTLGGSLSGIPLSW